MTSQRWDTQQNPQKLIAYHSLSGQTVSELTEENPKQYKENDNQQYSECQFRNFEVFKGTLPKDLLMLAWNARVGNSLDNTLSQAFVAQAGTKSH